MQGEQFAQAGPTVAAQESRRPYRAPEVRLLGSVDQLTRGSGTLSTNDTFGTKAKPGASQP